MSFSKVLCIAVTGSILFTGAAMARPDAADQPPAKAAAKAHHRHKGARKAIHKHIKHARKHQKGSGTNQPQ